MFRPRSAEGRRGPVPGPSYRARQRQSPRSRPRRRRCRPPHREENQGLAPEPAPARPKYDARDASQGRAIAACTLEESWLLQFRQGSPKRVPDHIVRWYRARQAGAVVAAPLDAKRLGIVRGTCHLPARFSAAPAHLCAFVHNLVVWKSFATHSARIAHLGADLTDTTMRQRTTEHEARARRAEIDAVQKRLKVTGFRVATASVEAVRHRGHTDVVTLLALLNRCLLIDVLV